MIKVFHTTSSWDAAAVVIDVEYPHADLLPLPCDAAPEYGVIKRLGFDKGAMTQCVSSGKAKLKEFNPRGRQA